MAMVALLSGVATGAMASGLEPTARQVEGKSLRLGGVTFDPLQTSSVFPDHLAKSSAAGANAISAHES